MADAINDLGTCDAPGVDCVALGHLWSIHQQGEKWRFDVRSADEKDHLTVPLLKPGGLNRSDIDIVIARISRDAKERKGLQTGAQGMLRVLKIGCNG